ncbi:MAG: hypothetical protein KA250_15955 [Verrucomicrobiales bacterium]|jgi:hypothetical protein|nr:hypothetical protein [Verrucomicrobiales bacterium]MBP9223284.1 hypothetical protein [Verrucomicrobiales bacterium]HQZ28957.1 hypothetical protein [Verrucomicrobiales bacterium]
MDLLPNSFSVGLLVGLIPGLIALGVFLGYRLARKHDGSAPPALWPVPVAYREKNPVPTAEVPGSEDEGDDPTAPITPVIEMSRSPHDSHRDLSVGNALVKNLELLELLLKSSENQTKESLLRQIGMISQELQALLPGCSFRAFSFEPGTYVDSDMRSRIRIVTGTSGESRTRIVRTLRGGFLYDAGGDEEPVVIRKAEVEIG